MSLPTWVMCAACGYTWALHDPSKVRVTADDLACKRCGSTTASVEEHPEAAGMPEPGMPEKNR